ncbi:hypothetical protein CLOM_g16050 [Closterium sp. NIES-68]|nr:hypothetical protein CLOM_g16050 [Closterium sp. NIES-68]GJP72031.1 hypothetical protein CLOP_g2803 [Closterium sp. NIES-67]
MACTDDMDEPMLLARYMASHGGKWPILPALPRFDTKSQVRFANYSNLRQAACSTLDNMDKAAVVTSHRVPSTASLIERTDFTSTEAEVPLPSQDASCMGMEASECRSLPREQAAEGFTRQLKISRRASFDDAVVPRVVDFHVSNPDAQAPNGSDSTRSDSNGSDSTGFNPCLKGERRRRLSSRKQVSGLSLLMAASK